MTQSQPPLSWPALLDDRDTIDRYREQLGYLEEDAGGSTHPPELVGIGKANAFSIVKKVQLLQPRLTEPPVCDPARAMTFHQIQEVSRHRRDRRYYREPRWLFHVTPAGGPTPRSAAGSSG